MENFQNRPLVSGTFTLLNSCHCWKVHVLNIYFSFIIFCLILTFSYLFFRQVDILIQGINQMFQDMNLTLSRPFGNNAVVQVLYIFRLFIPLFKYSKIKSLHWGGPSANYRLRCISFCSNFFENFTVYVSNWSKKNL